MHERIQALIERASYRVIETDGAPIISHEFDKEKFAELIVRECALFLEENSGYNDVDDAWHPEPEELLQHFGML